MADPTSTRGRARLEHRAEARTFKVEDLLQHVRLGRLRVPPFQRPLRWRSGRVRGLFDSIYLGYPIGDLLLAQRPGIEADLTFGGYVVHAQKREDAWYLVDGQQRVTALVGALLHPSDVPVGDIFAIWFDLSDCQLRWAAKRQDIQSHWVPMRVLADTRALHRWWSQSPLQKESEDLVETLYDASKAIREYVIPAYILTDASDKILGEVFRRTNNTAFALTEADVFDALHAANQGVKPTSLLLHAIEDLGFGEPKPELLLRFAKAALGVDPGTDLDGDVALPVAEIGAALRRAFLFLKREAGVLHLKLSPYVLPLIVLCRFFAVHPDPSPRDRILLIRWVWRGLLSAAHADSNHAAVRRIQPLIRAGDASGSVAALLSDLRGRLRSGEHPIPNPAGRWIGTSANTRLCELALAALDPRDPVSGEHVDLDQVCDALTGGDPGVSFPSGLAVTQTPTTASRVAAHFLLPGGKDALRAVRACNDEAVLESHALDLPAMALWRTGEVEAFIARRAALLSTRMTAWFDARAAWDDNDRPSLEALKRAALEAVDGRA